MASKPPPRVVLPRAPRSSLKATDVPGVFKNRQGLSVDENGVMLDFKGIKKRDDARFTEVLGKTADNPLDFMKGVMLDPRRSATDRYQAAKDALPYTTPKLHAIQGVAGAAPIGIEVVEKMSKEQLDRYEKALIAAMTVAGEVGK